MSCGAWEFIENRLYVGTPNGKIMEIEIGTFDYTEVNEAVPIEYKCVTRM